MRELGGRLSRVPAKLIHLAGRGLHMEYGTVIDGLPDGRVNHVRVSGADCIHAAATRVPIAAQNIPEMGTRIMWLRGTGRRSRASRKTVAASSHYFRPPS